MATKSKINRLTGVLIKRIAVCKNPAVGGSEMVLMKSGQTEDELDTFVKNLGGRLLDWFQERLQKTQTDKENDMDLSKLTPEELSKARPDLVEAIKKTVTANPPPAAAGTETKVEKSADDPFKAIRDSLDKIGGDLTAFGARVEKLEKAAAPDITAVNTAVENLTKSVTDINGKLETLSKAAAKPSSIAHGAESEDVAKSTFGGAFKTLRRK